MNINDMNDIEAEENAHAFAQTLTMAELAYFEKIVGTSVDKATTQDSMSGMIAVAAYRLGVELTLDETRELTFAQALQLLDKALTLTTAPVSDKVASLLEMIAGK